MKHVKSTFLGAALAALVLTTTTALAGSGVGGVFNLGQVNTVDAQTSLSGNPGANPQLKLTNNGTNAGIRVDSAGGIGVNGVSVSGTGQQGQSQSGIGLLGIHASSTGLNAGVEGRTASTDANGAGVLGRNTGGGPGLRAVVNAGAPPLAVNSSVKVASLNADLLDGFDSSKLWQTGGNAGTTAGTNFLGTSDNQPLELKVNGQRALRLEPNTTSPNLIGGFPGNIIKDGAFGVTIAGGGGFGTGGGANVAYDNLDVIGGGSHNAVGQPDGDPAVSPASTVAGGYANTATGAQDTVSGGNANTASNDNSTIAGGSANTASAFESTVAGGQENTASGQNSIVAGGALNTASGDDSFAAGTNAVANHQYSFVWSDNQFTSQVTSPADFSFTAHAIGGFNLWTNSSGPTTGCSIPAGGGSWVCTSNRSAKDDFVPVDRNGLLRHLNALPITTWHYKNEKAGVRHIGPMAQGFARAFHFGQSTTGIATVDSEGVALAAIQGLYRQNQALERQNRTLDARLTRLERLVAGLKR